MTNLKKGVKGKKSNILSERYNRQELLVEIGKKGQQKIRKATVAIAGVGALGTVAAEILCRAGIKRLILVDRDVVEESNLQRQALFTTADLNKPKAVAAKERLKSINPEVDVVALADELTPQTIQGYLEKAEVILDGLDNVSTRLLLNDFCVKNKIPWIGGGAIKEKGFVLPFPVGGACYQCVFRNAEDQTGHTETCDTVGVLGSITHLIGSLQAAECIKMILRHPQQQKMTHINLWRNTWTQAVVEKRETCPPCHGRFFHLNKRPHEGTTKICGTDSYQVRLKKHVDLASLKKRLKNAGSVWDHGVCLKFRNLTIFKNRVLIKAGNKEKAEQGIAKYLGL